MPTELGQFYPPSWRGRYPHMLDEDIPIWNRYLDLFGYQFQRIYYDVRVGGPDPGIFGDDVTYGTMWYQLNAKRIDALAEKDNDLWLIEVSVRPGLRAVGQLLTYMSLWATDPKILKPVIPYLVCQQLDPDLAFVLKSQALSWITI